MNTIETRTYNLEQYNLLRNDFYFQDHQSPSLDYDSAKTSFMSLYGNSEESKNQGNPLAACSSFGRVTFIRRIGKIAFIKVRLGTSEMQLVFKKDITLDYQASSFIDLGDWVSFAGAIGLTSTGEVSLFVEHFTIKRKCLENPPAKWEGVTDKDIIYNSRHIDLLSNIDSAKIFVERSKIVKNFRNYFEDKGLLEVETALFSKQEAGGNAEQFTTYHNASDKHLFLRTAPELNLKRLMVGNLSPVGVFEIGSCFRNEGVSNRHQPNFSSLEAYSYSPFPTVLESFNELMKMSVELARMISNPNKEVVVWSFWTDSKDTYKELNIPEDTNIVEAFDNIIEEHLSNKYKDKILIVKDHPKSISPLAKEMANTGYTARLELYMNGIELMNGFVECDDPVKQKENFDSQGYVDDDYINALNYGLPMCIGLGIGIDRSVAIATGCTSIKDVILFPV